MVVGELHMGDLVCPGTQVGSAVDPKVCFNLLVDMFCLSIRLRVIGSQEEKAVVEELSKFLGKGGCELWTTIRDDLVIESKMEVDLMEKKGSYPFGSDGLSSVTENYPFCKTMVNHNQQGIKAGRDREVGDEVTGDLLEGTGCAGLN